jgi:cytochrome c oxidase subunit I+III
MVSMIVPTMAGTRLLAHGLGRDGAGGHRLPQLRALGAPHVRHGHPGAEPRLLRRGGFAVSIPSGIQVFAWIGHLRRGQGEVEVPTLYILGFLFIFVLAG